MWQFSGTLTRKDFWLRTLGIIIATLASFGIMLALDNSPAIVILLVVIIALIIESWAILIRRTRDVGIHWAFAFLTMIPYAGFAIFLIIGSLPTNYVKDNEV